MVWWVVAVEVFLCHFRELGFGVVDHGIGGRESRCMPFLGLFDTEKLMSDEVIPVLVLFCGIAVVELLIRVCACEQSGVSSSSQETVQHMTVQQK